MLRRRLLVCSSWVCLLAGCGAPPATVDLLSVAREGVARAGDQQEQLHEQKIRQLEGNLDALDRAFDADVRLVASGGVTAADGEVLELTPEWVISSRKGYAAGRSIIQEQIRRELQDHALRRENLHAVDDALEMARRLLVRQQLLLGRMGVSWERLERRIRDDQR